MATKSKRKVTFDAKRAARFEDQGVRVDNIDPRQVAVGLEGYEEEGANCALCDHDIKWLYVLHLGLTDRRTVTFNPVGSTCIATWVESLPISEAQAAIVAALKLAEEEAEIIKASFREFNRQVEKGDLSAEDRDALVRFLSAPPRVRSVPFLADVARKVERFSGWASDNQRGAWLAALNRELINAKRPPLKSIPPSSGSLSQDDVALLARAKAVIENPAALGTLSTDKREALQDIHSKVTQYQSFRSDAQRQFLADIVRKAESGRQRKVEAPARPATPAPAPRPVVAYEGDDLPF